MTFLSVIVIAFIVVMSIISSINRVNLRVNLLEDEINKLKKLLILNKRAEVKAIDKPDVAIMKTDEVSISVHPKSKPKVAENTENVKIHPATFVVAQNTSSEVKVKEKSEFWAKIEKMFAENAIGIIGVTAVIVGIIFLVIYAAISMGPLARFIVVCGFSILFYAMYFILAKKEFWQNIALWMRTASGVVFLVGCIGSSHFSYMKWIGDDAFGMLLVFVGIFVNIAFGALSKKQMFATVHILLSLFALLLIPFSYMLFIIAAIICFSGMIMTLGNRKWNAHLAIVNVAFMLINVFWSMNYFSIWPESSLPTIGICLAVALPCLLSHYRRIYDGWDTKALVAHLIIWITLGVNLYMHSRGTIFSTVGLAFGAFITFILSYYANRIKADWLYACDRMVSLALGILTCISFYKFDIEYYQIAFCVSVFSLVFFRLNSYIKNKTTFEISNLVVVLSYIVFFIMIFIDKTVDAEKLISLIISYGVIAILLPSLEKYARKEGFGFEIDEQSKEKTTILPMFFALHLIAVAYFSSIMPMNNNIWFAVSFAMSVYAIIFKEVYKNSFVNASVVFAVMASSVYHMFLIYSKNYDLMLNIQLFAMAFMTGTLGLICSWAEKRQLRSYSSGIILIWGVLMFAAYKLTIAYSTMLPGVLWLLIFILCSDIKELTWKKAISAENKDSPNVLVTKLSEITLAVFALRFCLIDLSNYTLLLDMIPARIGTELLSLVALLYWMMSGTKVKNEYIKKSINSLLEVFVIFSLFYIFAEVKLVDQGIVFAGIALFSISIAKKMGMYDRIGLYSYVFFFVALFNIGFVCASSATPSLEIYEQTWFKSMIAIAIAVVFTFIGGKKLMSSQAVKFHTPNKISLALKNLIFRYDVNAVIYPLFATVAFFFYRGFDKSVLSVLWMVECFVLFMISIVMKKAEFRVVAMWCVAVISVRIILFDLRGQDFLLKAIVFMVVGSILIVMNTIYNKYKYRYEK